jgi:hypothetical protein
VGDAASPAARWFGAFLVGCGPLRALVEQVSSK